jgi:hypothetical protein
MVDAGPALTMVALGAGKDLANMSTMAAYVEVAEQVVDGILSS